MQELSDPVWLGDLAFLVDITKHLNVLNISLQGKDAVGMRRERMKRAKRSAVWSHFKLVNDDKDAKCTIYIYILKYN